MCHNTQGPPAGQCCTFGARHLIEAYSLPSRGEVPLVTCEATHPLGLCVLCCRVMCSAWPWQRCGGAQQQHVCGGSIWHGHGRPAPWHSWHVCRFCTGQWQAWWQWWYAWWRWGCAEVAGQCSYVWVARRRLCRHVKLEPAHELAVLCCLS